jgi:hypothetical protein
MLVFMQQRDCAGQFAAKIKRMGPAKGPAAENLRSFHGLPLLFFFLPQSRVGTLLTMPRSLLEINWIHYPHVRRLASDQSPIRHLGQCGNLMRRRKEARFDPMHPIVAVAALLALLIALALMTLSAAALNLSDRAQALGLPDGSIRAIIALGLIVLFAVISIFLYRVSALTRL